MSRISITARVVVHDGRAEDYLAAFTPLLEQAEREPGTPVYTVHRCATDPHLFWTTESYADQAAFDTHQASRAHTAATPHFAELVAESDVLVGQPVLEINHAR